MRVPDQVKIYYNRSRINTQEPAIIGQILSHFLANQQDNDSQPLLYLQAIQPVDDPLFKLPDLMMKTINSKTLRVLSQQMMLPQNFAPLF
jgi:hypothetical protein